VSTSFDPTQGLIVITAQIYGPAGHRRVRLALDTGAMTTMINTVILINLGYDPALSPDRLQMTTASGVEYVPRIAVDKINALGQERTGFPVVVHTLPPSASVDGLLGLDFFRGQQLTLDFRNGQITLQ
jgi:predicted aspartyl protease